MKINLLLPTLQPISLHRASFLPFLVSPALMIFQQVLKFTMFLPAMGTLHTLSLSLLLHLFI